MCGIVGGFDRFIGPGVAALAHRGPDAQGLEGLGRIHFGHTRLAILDLDKRSNQPFIYDGLMLVYNGELWNYKALRSKLVARNCHFQTSGDTEVVAAALKTWGTDALAYFEGMYSLAWTSDGETLYLARDRFGETPLHIANEQPFAFASELKALQALGCHAQSFQDFPPGTWAKVTRESITFTNYYTPPIYPKEISLADAVPLLQQFIALGVKERTISDVPVCTLLSGGIDSAAIAYHLKQSFPNLVAYTAVFNRTSSDLAAARRTAEHLDVELREITIPTPTTADLSDVISVIEMPYKAQVEIGWPCLLLAQVIQADGFKVCYSGEGSDELWASYGFAYHGLKTKDWHTYRRDLFMSQARKNFMRCNKVFMKHSIECRLPFLSRGLVEFALSLPQTSVQEGKGRPKAIMQDAYRGLLPETTLKRPKVAFQDGLGLKEEIARTLPRPEAYYRSEYVRLFN